MIEYFDADRASCSYDPAYDRFPLYAFEDRGPNSRALLSVEGEDVPSGHIAPQTPIMLKRPAAQRIMDSLWASGLRPTNEQDKSAEVEYLRQQLNRATKFAFGE